MSDAPHTDEQLAKAAHCAAPDDLYSLNARELISRTCRAFLDGVRATPTELLFNADLQRKLSDAGTNYAGAVQKIAIAQVSGVKNRDVAGRIKEIFALCDTVRDRLLKATADAPVDILVAATLAQQLGSLQADPQEREMRLSMMLAKTLQEDKDWAGKARLILGFMAAVPEGRDAVADQVPFDKALGEILRIPVGLDAVLGKHQKSIGARIQLLHSLALGKPGTADISACPPLARELADLLARHALPATRAALRSQMVAATIGTYPLTTGSAATELSALFDLTPKLREKSGQYIGGEEVEAALARRMSRLINDQTIYDIMGNTPRLADRLQRCLDIYGRTIGDQNLDFLKKYIDYLLQERTVSSDVAPKDTPMTQRLRGVTELHQIVSASNLSAVFRGKLALRLEEVQAHMLEEGAVLDRIVKRGKSSADKAVALMDLCRPGTLIKGPELRRAQELAQRYIKQDDFLPSFMAGAASEEDQKRLLIDLHSRLAEIGLTD